MQEIEIVITNKTKKSFNRLPKYIVDKLYMWVDEVFTLGLAETRKISGYHDEPLKGKLRGYRSIRLNKAYRAVYHVVQGEIELVEIVEVNKHEYRS